jgi:phosphopantothenoylcysteine decarboxylase/phosphopantothenate--cysteine ligase
LPAAAALFMVAAVSDFRPEERAAGKIRRSSGLRNIAVKAAPDLMAEAAESASASCVKVAFAVELGEGGLESARAKLERKGAHLLVLNDPSEPGSGFGAETNRVTLIDRDGRVEELPLMRKSEVADAVLDRAERYMSSD